MSIYKELNITPMINAAGTYTVVGGSRMSENTLEAMKQAAQNHVDIPQLQDIVQRKVAVLTNNEASVICNGAASGLYLCAISAIALKKNKKSKYLNLEEITQCEILAMSAQHIPYDYAVRQSGVKQSWIGYPNIEGSMTVEDLENGINENTAAIFYYISSPYGLNTPGVLSLEETLSIGIKNDIPVIVDAAAQLPPVENLWKITSAGATAVIFSGGKDLRGPQSSGLIVGKQNFLKIVQETNFPNYGFGRLLKTGREEIVGLYSAIKEYLTEDSETRDEFAEKSIERIIDTFSKSSLYGMQRIYPNEAGQPMPYIQVRLKKPIDINHVADAMQNGSPSVFIKPEGGCFYINPMTLREDEIDPVIKKLKIVENQFIK